MSSITINNARIFYQDDGKTVLNVPALTITSGINFIVGGNGSGKSTFLKALTNHFPEVIFEGEIAMNGRKYRHDKVGLVRQSPINSISTNLTFLENMLMARFSEGDLLRPQRMITKSETNDILGFLDYFVIKEKVEMLLDKEASKLSAGQQQLLAILMRLFRFKEVILLDEATANLDVITTKTIIGILSEIAKKGTIVLFATHQMSLLEMKRSKIYNTINGKICPIQINAI